MNLAQLIDLTQVHLRGKLKEIPEAGEIAVLLNQAQDEASRELGIPTRYVDLLLTEAPFALPKEARDDGVISVQLATTGHRLRLFNTHEANMTSANWMLREPRNIPDFIIYDPANITAPLYPVPPPDADNKQELRVHYVAKPSDMNEPTDQPFEAQLPQYHIMLVFYVVFMLSGDQGYFSMYRDSMRQAFGKVAKMGRTDTYLSTFYLRRQKWVKRW